jgi:alpha-glucosidase
MPWADPPDPTMLDVYRRLGALRAGSPALRRGGLRWLRATDDALVFLRESRHERLLVQVSRADHDPVRLPAAHLDGDVVGCRLGDDVKVAGSDVVLPAAGAGVQVWELDP